MNFLPIAIEKYAQQHTSAESELLNRINRETHLEVLKPRMLSGHFQGRILSMFSHMVKPVRILEIGTYTGYATLCLAEGLVDQGKIVTIDINAELENRVRKYFAQSQFSNKIDYRIGNALEVISKLNEKWDLVFIDADKENYSRYYDLIIDQVNQGGLIIADNVLWSGKVVEVNQQDLDTQRIREFNLKVQQDQSVENVLFPIRDGLMVARKL